MPYDVVDDEVRALQDAHTAEPAGQAPARRKSPGKPFKKGQSGNPAGRPRGSKNKATLVKQAIEAECHGILMDRAPSIISTVAEQALDGCRQSQKLIWNAVIPNKKAIEVSGKDGKDPVFNIVVRAMETGKEVNIEEPLDAEFEEIHEGSE